MGPVDTNLQTKTGSAMNKRLLSTLLASSIIALQAVTPIGAQAVETPAAGDKRAEILQLLDAMRATKEAEMGFNLMMNAEISSLSDAIRESIDKQPGKTTAEKDEEKKAVIAKLDEYMDHFKAHVLEEVDFKKVVRDTFVNLYDKYYSTEEIDSLLAFYRSPVGQKTLDVAPKLTQEAIQNINGSMKDGMQRAQQKLQAEIQADKAKAAEAAGATKPITTTK
jgi:hypothetical protein